MAYNVIKKMYRNTKDIETGKPYQTVNITKGWRLLSKLEAETVKQKMITDPLWIYTVEAA